MDLAEKGTAASGSGQGDGQGEHQDEPDEFKSFGLPLARIKKVMKSDPDVKVCLLLYTVGDGLWLTLPSTADDLGRRYKTRLNDENRYELIHCTLF